MLYKCDVRSDTCFFYNFATLGLNEFLRYSPCESYPVHRFLFGFETHVLDAFLNEVDEHEPARHEDQTNWQIRVRKPFVAHFNKLK